MHWILDKLPVLLFVLVFVAKIVDAIAKARKAKQAHETARDPGEEQRRVEEVQAEIRRTIAQRRRGAPVEPVAPASVPQPRPLLRRAETTELPADPIGGALRRVLEGRERKMPAPAPEPPPVVQHRWAEMERQQQLADQMKALEESRALAQRRAAQLAEEQKAAASSAPQLLSAARARTIEDLRDPQALRRAFVLREVLGTPVGLR